MAYNFFPTGYQPYYPVAQPNNPTVPQSNAGNQQSNNLMWVQGEESAKSYLVAPNQTVTLWDTESDTIYIKSADQSGMPSMKILDYVIRDSSKSSNAEANFATKDEIESIRDEIDNLKRKFESKISER